jgi:hypothetical protein
LVIVNQAGKWIGKIVGSPDGANMAGSAGTEFEVDPITGEVTAVGANTSNSGNGDNTTNTASNNTTNNSTTTQSNDAKIQNNLNLTANTGGNATNFNTGGNSNIKTGDVNVIANLVNFVNNNITGGGKLVVTVVNVFGSWIGDFVAPGQQKQAHNTTSGSSNGGGSNNNNNNGNSNSGGSSIVSGAKGNALITANVDNSGNTNTYGAGSVEGANTTGGSTHNEATVAKSVGQDGSATVAKKTIAINLAWLLLALPMFGIAMIAKKSFVPVRTLAIRGIHLFL